MYIDLSSNQGREVGLHVSTSSKGPVQTGCIFRDTLPEHLNRRCPANLVPWNEHVHTHVEAKLGVERRF